MKKLFKNSDLNELNIDNILLNSSLTDICKIEPYSNTYVYFKNTVNQQWILPIDNLRASLALFMPNSRKGFIVKIILPYLLKNKRFRKITGLKLTNLKLNDKFHELCNSLFHNKKIDYSFYLGSPGKNQKTTIQLSEGKRLLGYCKIKDKTYIYELFIKEKEILQYLRNKQITSIPKCLFCGRFDQQYVFIMSTERTLSSNFKQHNDLAWEFVNELYEKTKKQVAFTNSPYYKTLKNLITVIQTIDIKERAFISDEVNNVLKRYNQSMFECSMYHGDFTPWNSFMHNNHLFVFDFEYAQYDYPPYLDYFHYITQSALNNHREVEWIVNFYKEKVIPLFKYTKLNPSNLYRMYLLDIIYQYIQNDIIDGKLNPSLKDKISTWVKIMKQIN